jgi:predicted transcriptional regulator of viral defense system
VDKKKAYQILELADNHDGYVSVEEAKAHGIAQTYLSEEEKQGLFRRVAKGLYLKRGYPLDPYFLLHYKYKKAVFSLRSALALHGLIDSNEINVNLPNNYMTKGIEGAKSRHVGNKEFNVGLALAVTPNGTLVPCYDIERSVLDTIRYLDQFTRAELSLIWKGMLRIIVDAQSSMEDREIE